MKKHQIKCVIFDCDGVLVDSETMSIQAIVDLARPLGYTVDFKTSFEKFTGQRLAVCFDFIEQQVGQKLPEDFLDSYRKLSFERYKEGMEPIEGVKELIESLDVPFCVASNAPEKKVRLNLTTVGLIDRFEGRLFSAYNVGKWKPDPTLFLHAAQTMGFAPEECAVIEDSLPGVQAAIAGGFQTFAFAKPHNEQAFRDLGARVFYEMKELDLF